jgi:ubiquinone/menaquinone biosynthesis C-methylase UbiE
MDKDHRTKTLKGFGRQARAFARSPVHLNPERLRRLVEFVAPRAGERVLDAACGPGIVTGALAASGMRAVGVDLTAEMIAEARASQDGFFVRGDGLRLPFGDRTFDVVVSRNSLHHMAGLDAVIGEMVRVLRPGGRLVVEDMRAPDDAERRAYHERIERLRDDTHTRSLTEAELHDLGARAGLVDPRTLRAQFEIDFEEWTERAYSPAENRRQARSMMEASVDEDRCGLRVWWQDGRLRFERQSMLYSAVRSR